MAGITALGDDWTGVRANLQRGQNAVTYMEGWDCYDDLITRLGAPIVDFSMPEHYTRKQVRSMGRVALLATRASEMALEDAGLLGDPMLGSGQMGISYGSSAGSPAAVGEFGNMLINKKVDGINATSYIKMMSHTAPVNIGIFFGLKGRVITTSSACTSGSQGIGYAYETIRHGLQTAMIAGGAEELCATQAAVFDTLFATSTVNHQPHLSPRPFDANRDGLVIGEGAGTLILEELEHARARGARIHAEIVGFGTNSDGTHVTHPVAEYMCTAMKLALQSAQLPAAEIGYVNAHGTATEHGDVAESQATGSLFGSAIPISSLKSYLGHTLGACGAIEAWATINMLNDDWYAPTVNLIEVDPRCAELDYIVGEGRTMSHQFVMSNNFAFGGINTSLIFRRWR
jgi:3-oxoacyl-[acyl-carrier-protein] synthase II